MNTHIMQYSFHILPTLTTVTQKGDKTTLGFTPPLLKL